MNKIIKLLLCLCISQHSMHGMMQNYSTQLTNFSESNYTENMDMCYVPHGANILNQIRWNDPIAEKIAQRAQELQVIYSIEESWKWAAREYGRELPEESEGDDQESWDIAPHDDEAVSKPPITEEPELKIINERDLDDYQITLPTNFEERMNKAGLEINDHLIDEYQGKTVSFKEALKAIFFETYVYREEFKSGIDSLAEFRDKLAQDVFAFNESERSLLYYKNFLHYEIDCHDKKRRIKVKSREEIMKSISHLVIGEKFLTQYAGKEISLQCPVGIFNEFLDFKLGNEKIPIFLLNDDRINQVWELEYSMIFDLELETFNLDVKELMLNLIRRCLKESQMILMNRQKSGKRY